MTLLLPPKVARNLEGHARKCFPRECCGVLLGKLKNSVLEVVDAWAAPNVAPDRDRFAISPSTLLELERKARHGDLAILGFYHSHPGGDTFPSKIDCEGAIPGSLHLILALNGRGSMEKEAWIHLGSGGPEPVRLTMAAP